MQTAFQGLRRTYYSVGGARDGGGRTGRMRRHHARAGLFGYNAPAYGYSSPAYVYSTPAPQPYTTTVQRSLTQTAPSPRRPTRCTSPYFHGADTVQSGNGHG